MSPFYISLGIFMLLAAAAVAVHAAITSRYRTIDERVADMSIKARVAYGVLSPSEIEEKGVRSALFRWATERLPEPRLGKREARTVAALLVRAGYFSSSAVRTFQLLCLFSTAASIVLATAVSFAAGSSGLGGAALIFASALLGARLPHLVVGRKARARQQEIATQLSDVLDLLVVCVEAGLGISEAIKVVGSESERQGQAIGRELGQVSGELAAGASLGQALHALAERTKVDDIKPLAATMIQSEQLGAQMGPALRAISDGLRTARRLRAEEAAQRTTIKMLFPLIFFVLPAMIGVIIGPAIIEMIRTLAGAAK